MDQSTPPVATLKGHIVLSRAEIDTFLSELLDTMPLRYGQMYHRVQRFFMDRLIEPPSSNGREAATDSPPATEESPDAR